MPLSDNRPVSEVQTLQGRSQKWVTSAHFFDRRILALDVFANRMFPVAAATPARSFVPQKKVGRGIRPAIGWRSISAVKEIGDPFHDAVLVFF